MPIASAIFWLLRVLYGTAEGLLLQLLPYFPRKVGYRSSINKESPFWIIEALTPRRMV